MADPSDSEWFVWYAILRGEPGTRSVLIGAGGFLGPPDVKGDVEIGYSVSEAWRGRGLGREMVEGLVRAAFDDARVTRLVAHAAGNNIPSRSILEGAGFVPVGSGPDPGQIRFELHRRGKRVTG